MDAVINHLKGHAAQLDHGWAHPRLGIVTSVDSQTYSARVTIQPEGVLTGWLPIAAGWTGNNWGMVCAPSPGDQVVVLWQEGDAEQGLVAGRIWSNVATPPVAPAGEFWLVHRSGSCLKLHNDGSIESGGTVWHHNGDLRVSGDVYDNHGPMSGPACTL
ncbi:MAG: phage baseplate assembly protein V [Rhodospirillales bacterium]